MPTAELFLDTHHQIAEIDANIFSGFLEHLGRAVYEGIYDPGNKLSDEHGYRRDVLDALKRLEMPLMRYPGGNFVSCYDWKDGIGPRADRKPRPDYAWSTVETNQFGTDEFMHWCKAANTQPMMAVNLGTAGTKEAGELVEYCNLPTGFRWSDERAKNGSAEPYAVKYWCLGNEMDGPWQAGHIPAYVYAQRAQQAGKLMKGLDNSIKTIACGSSARGMSTYLAWDREILEYCWDDIDYLSVHRYSNNDRGDSAWFLAEGVEIDRVLADYAGLLDYVRGMKKSEKRVHICFDEWNVWYKARDGNGGWKPAPHLLEEVYNFEDALVCAQYLSAFIRRADVVKIAAIAQIVNVIAPILTSKDGILIQSIFHIFEAYRKFAKGVSLRVAIDGPTYKAGERGDVPSIDAAASFDAASGEVSVFIVNRDQKTPTTLTIHLDDRAVGGVLDSVGLSGFEVKAANTWQSPNVITPAASKARVEGGALVVELAGPSFAAVKVSTTAR